MKQKNKITFFLFSLSFFFLFSCKTETTDLSEPEVNPPLTYNIGDEGPAGGFVFYDKGTYSDGWRYLEAAPVDFGDTDLEWGCYNHSVPASQFLTIGSGLSNSEAILASHDSLTNYYSNPAVCSDLSNGTVAAKVCLEYELNGFDNWHLPSEDEVFAMYENLHLNGWGDFQEPRLYWCSSEHGSNTATATDFEDGSQGLLCKQCRGVVTIRAVRYF